jgi:hypothetical protein
MGRACVGGGREMYTFLYLGKPKERDYFEVIEVDGKLL